MRWSWQSTTEKRWSLCFCRRSSAASKNPSKVHIRWGWHSNRRTRKSVNVSLRYLSKTKLEWKSQKRVSVEILETILKRNNFIAYIYSVIEKLRLCVWDVRNLWRSSKSNHLIWIQLWVKSEYFHHYAYSKYTHSINICKIHWYFVNMLSYPINFLYSIILTCRSWFGYGYMHYTIVYVHVSYCTCIIRLQMYMFYMISLYMYMYMWKHVHAWHALSLYLDKWQVSSGFGHFC